MEIKFTGPVVRAVRVGFYGGRRHYPANWPNPRAPHPEAGKPFRLMKPEDFSDSQRKGKDPFGRPLPPGWMELVEEPQPAKQQEKRNVSR